MELKIEALHNIAKVNLDKFNKISKKNEDLRAKIK